MDQIYNKMRRSNRSGKKIWKLYNLKRKNLKKAFLTLKN